VVAGASHEGILIHKKLAGHVALRVFLVLDRCTSDPYA
jgi:hypothetical protein